MEAVKAYYYRYLRYFLAKESATATTYDKYLALCYAVRSMLVDGWIETQRKYHKYHMRRVYFISTEYLLGKRLQENIINLGIENNLQKAARELGFSLEEIYDQEDELALGNGREARLAASFQEAMATMNISATSYGLRYDYGQFRQVITNHTQKEEPYDLLHKGHPWEIIRPEYSCKITYPGNSKNPDDAIDDTSPHLGKERLYAVPYDIPMVGYRNGIVNNLRLWSSREAEIFPPEYGSHQDYVRACMEINESGKVSSILFPDEDIHRATQLRLKQRYFLVSASLQDILRRFKRYNRDLHTISTQVVIHIHGLQCAIAIPEMVRLLTKKEGVTWEEAWKLTREIFIFTSYAMESKPVESWPEYLMKQVFPDCLSIIYQIEEYLKSQVNAEQYRQFPLIEDGLVRRIRMDTLAALGAYSINEPVSYIKNQMERAYPNLKEPDTTQFSSISAGVSHRRWIMTANTPLSGMISELIGHEWITRPQQLLKLKDHIDDEELLFKFNDLRLIAKQKLAGVIAKQFGISIDPSSLFDVHTTRINLYKRQLLQLFHILDVYCRAKNGEPVPTQKRVHIFSGKATHTDYLAKQILMLINLTAELVNNDPKLDDIMKVVFIPGFSMTWAAELIPATDIYESLGLPGVENSPTTCLKYAFNGALLVGSKTRTLNEVEKNVGPQHSFLFGTAHQKGSDKNDYSPAELIKKSPSLKRIVTTIEQCLCKKSNNDYLKPLLASFRDTDNARIMYDFEDYLHTQQKIDSLYSDSTQWAQKCLCTIAGFGHFSTDRVIGEYASRLWRLPDYE